MGATDVYFVAGYPNDAGATANLVLVIFVHVAADPRLGCNILFSCLGPERQAAIRRDGIDSVHRRLIVQA